MNKPEEKSVWPRLLLLLMPLAILFLMPGGALIGGALWFWLTFIFIWFLHPDAARRAGGRAGGSRV
jgi:hypothetical protein